MLFNTLKSVLLILSISLLFVQCKKENSCDEVMCTMEFRSYTVRIEDGAGNPVSLDRAEIHVGSKQVFSIILPDQTDPYTYTIASDAWLNSVGKNLELPSELWIYRNSALVSKIPYVFQTDCCHLSKISGTDTVVIP